MLGSFFFGALCLRSVCSFSPLLVPGFAKKVPRQMSCWGCESSRVRIARPESEPDDTCMCWCLWMKSIFIFNPFFSCFPFHTPCTSGSGFLSRILHFYFSPSFGFFFARPATTPRGKRSFSIGPGLGVAGKVGLMQSAGKLRLLTYAHRWQV